MFIVSLLAAAKHGFAEWRRKQQAYSELMALDDRSLADIGVRRSEIPAIVEGHHGTICVEERHTGPGARFRIALPI